MVGVQEPLLPPPQTFAAPPPPQVCGEVQVPHELTVREVPQLSLAVTEPQFLPRREQNVVLVSAVQLPPRATGFRSQARRALAVTIRTCGLLSAYVTNCSMALRRSCG